jgi:hypothetical protein
MSERVWKGEQEGERVMETFQKHLHLPVTMVDASARMMQRLQVQPLPPPLLPPFSLSWLSFDTASEMLKKCLRKWYLTIHPCANVHGSLPENYLWATTKFASIWAVWSGLGCCDYAKELVGEALGLPEHHESFAYPKSCCFV